MVFQSFGADTGSTQIRVSCILESSRELNAIQINQGTWAEETLKGGTLILKELETEQNLPHKVEELSALTQCPCAIPRFCNGFIDEHCTNGTQNFLRCR